MRPRTRRTLTWVALVALVCVGAAVLDASFLHTDDGCTVETHCLACRLIAGSTAVVGPRIALPFAVRTMAPLAPQAEPLLAEVAPRESQSRAPPLA